MPAKQFTTTRVAHNRLKLEGQQFGLLTVIEAAGRIRKQLYWRCLCQCGNFTTACTGNLRAKRTNSCGCREGAPTHRLSKTRGYHVWWSMNRRCFNPEDIGYKHYGARGITVCTRWRSVENFIADMGQPPRRLSIDRVNNNGNYSCGQCDECAERGWPMNCRWETYSGQNRNQRRNHYITAQGQTRLLVEWVLETGIPKNTILNRLNRGWSEEDAISRPVDTDRRRKIK